MVVKKIVISTFLIFFVEEFCKSEWIEMPEFSDNTRIYRFSGVKYGREKFIGSNSSGGIFLGGKNETSSLGEAEDHDGDDDDDDGSTEDPMMAEGSRGESFLECLPVELFKEVHKSLLENKGRIVGGKLEFLRSFEENLLTEIESRLIPLANPVRRKRGSGWEEDHMGFPSVESALLAISFLTFAVYLVQMVMMLFKNLPYNQPTNTVLVNRNKRTAGAEETERILRYLHEFSMKHKNPF